MEEKEKALHGGDHEGFIEKEYCNDVISIKIGVQVLGEQKPEDISKYIAMFSRRFYLDFFNDKGF